MSQDYFCRCHERPAPGPGWCRCQDKCPALWAIRMIEPTTLSHFLSHGLSPNLECGPYFDEYRDDPWNLLTVAIFHRRDDMMRILLEVGADFRTPKDWPYQFSTPLHLAIQLPKYEPFTRVSFLKVVKVLLEHGILYGTVGQDVNARVGWDEEQTAIIHLASTPQEDGAAIADLLLAHGAYVEDVSDHERPLTLAIAAPFPEIVERLVTNGADANYSDAIDFRPLNFAVGVLASDCSELLKLQSYK
ncbi:ankyrin repeat-containing domain protein [Pyronema domesticum]|nr:ankyrin repeat-containing domain protein [Pyronema domesticum]